MADSLVLLTIGIGTLGLGWATAAWLISRVR